VKYVLNGRTKQQMPHNYQFYEDFKSNEQRLHIESAIIQIDVPILIVHATDDPSVKYDEAEALHSWNPNNKLVAIEDSNHVFNTSHPRKNDKLPLALKTVVLESIDFIKV
jgi:pimeloyl-ACP methyl ester carboxylesterase